MRLASVVVCLACSLVVLAGCGGGTPDSPLTPRLDAAKAVSDTAARDKELVKLALEASAAGDIEIANSALDALSNDPLREQTKAKVVLRLAKAGKRAAAFKLQATIADANARERLRVKIRSKDFSE
jgi:hypothetical protein